MAALAGGERGSSACAFQMGKERGVEAYVGAACPYERQGKTGVERT